MFGLRYHVATLCAMFLMLGLGFLFGVTSSFGPALVRRQTHAIQMLSGRVDNVLTESAKDEQVLRQSQDALQRVLPNLVSDKLDGKRVALIRTGDYPDAADQATSAIVAAGGIVTSTTTITNRLSLLDPQQQAKVLSDLTTAAPSVSMAMQNKDANVAAYIPLVRVLRAGLAQHQDLQAALDSLTAAGIIDMSGDYTTPVSAIVVVGGNESGPGDVDTSDGYDITDVSVVAAVQDEAGNLPLVGCETSDAAESSIPGFAKAGISTVDCIDLPVGALDLPFALRGQAGAYGVKGTATRLIPASLDSKGSTAT